MRIINTYYRQDLNNDSIEIHLVKQDGDKKIINKVDGNNFRPYFYSKRVIESERIIDRQPIEALNGHFIKYTVKLPQDVVSLRQQDKEGNIEDFEADILYARRYVYDNNIQLGEEKLSKCYIDIETEMVKTHFPTPETDAITFISICSGAHKVVIAVNDGKYKLPDADDTSLIEQGFVLLLANSEQQLLEMFFNEVKHYSMLIGWNSRQFDMPFIRMRSAKYNLQQNCNNFVWADLLDLYRRFMSSYTTGKAPPSSLALDSVGKFELGYGKMDNAREALQATDMIRVAKYNLNDSELCEAIDKKTQLTDLVDNFGLVLNLLPDDCDYFGKMIELCIMREMRGRYIFKCKTKPKEGIKGIEGAYVHEPPTGIFRNIAVFDFAGLYPNIMRTFNTSPETVVDDDSTLPNLITTPIGHKFVRETGVYNKFITNLMELRKKYKKLKAETHDDRYEPLQQLTKYLINSMYGVTAHPTSRIYDKRIGETVTAVGRFMIHEIEKHFNVMYGDTDSVMIPIEDNGIASFQEQIEDIQKRMNQIVAQALVQFNTPTNYLNIRFEKMFDAVYFYGVKKRYYGRVVIDEDFSTVDKIVSRGLEIRRTDWCKLAVEYETTLLGLLLYDVKAARKFHEDYVSHVSSQPTESFVIWKKLQQPIEKYKNKPPHVRVARNTDWIGDKIGYVVTGYHGHKITNVVRYDEGVKIVPSYKYYIGRQIGTLYDRLVVPLIGQQKRLIS